ncbi:MAG: amidohydrolase family protein [Nitritalea sp.]
MCFWLGAEGNLLAQSDPNAKRRVTASYLLKGGYVVTAPGKSPEALDIHINEGLIEQVGKNLKVPVGTQTLLLDSLFIYAGFLDAASYAGVSTPPSGERPSNFDYTSPPDELAGISPWMDVTDFMDMRNQAIKDARKAGFTLGHMIPQGGMLPGKSALVVFGEEDRINSIRKEVTAVAKFRGARGMYPGTPLGVMAKFRDLYKNTELAARHERLFANAGNMQRPAVTKTQRALFPVVDQQLTVAFQVSNDLEARRAMRLQKELGFNLMLLGVDDVDYLVDELKATKMRVVLKPSLPKEPKAGDADASPEVKARLEKVQEAYTQKVQQAATLADNGILFAFGTMETKAGDALPSIRKMVAAGLKEEAALAALTTNPARILGVDNFIGRIEKGKLANFTISTAPVFSEDAQIKHVIADGFVYDYEVSQKKKAAGNGQAAPGITGEWDYESTTPAGSGGGTMTISREGERYSGTITYDDPAGGGKASASMQNIEFNEGKLRFSFDVSAAGMELQVRVSGDVAGSSFTGTMNIADFGTFPLSAEKKPTL